MTSGYNHGSLVYWDEGANAKAPQTREPMQKGYSSAALYLLLWWIAWMQVHPKGISSPLMILMATFIIRYWVHLLYCYICDALVQRKTIHDWRISKLGDADLSNMSSRIQGWPFAPSPHTLHKEIEMSRAKWQTVSLRFMLPWGWVDPGWGQHQAIKIHRWTGLF